MKELNADIVVVGGGCGGLTTAVAAAELGASVIILEKEATTGGGTTFAAGPFAVESRLQRRKMITLTRDEAFKIWMDFAHWCPDAKLVRAFIDRSGPNIDWLEDMGVPFYDAVAYYPGAHFIWHLEADENGVPISAPPLPLVVILAQKARDLGVQIFLNTPVKKILKEGDRVVGVMAEDKSGETVQANGRAVVIATGEIGRNRELIKKYTGVEAEAGPPREMMGMTMPDLQGDGIRMAWEIGAAEGKVSVMAGVGLAGGVGGPGGTGIEFASFRQPNLMVNLQGERFVNEELMENPPLLSNAVSGQMNKTVFLMFDGDTKKVYEEEGWDLLLAAIEQTKETDLDATIKKSQDAGGNFAYAEDSLEDLCAKTGIDLNGLRKTTDEYNKYCDLGRDEMFNKSYKYLRPIRRPKFYAAKFIGRAGNLLGGIKINHKTEVLTKDHKVIPGLYAVGSDSNALYGDTYPYSMAGSMMAFALASGRIAAEKATEYISKIK